MKKLTLILVCALFSSTFVLAQEDSDSISIASNQENSVVPKLRKNAIKLNLRFYPGPGFEYERSISNKSSLGVSCNAPIMVVIPYWRFYSGNNASNFYFEINAIAGIVWMVAGGGVGGSIGYKGYLHKKTGIIGELSLGCNAFCITGGIGQDRNNESGVIPHFNIAIGKRF